MLPLISIIIPVYNVEKYILDCLESVYNQTYNNIEVILVDDKGTDQSLKEIKNYFQVSPHYKYKFVSHEKNMGLSEARNSGLKVACGDYVFFLDSDDTLPKNSIQILLESALKYNSDITIGDLVCIDQRTQNKTNPFALKTDKKFISNNQEVFKLFQSGTWPVIGPNKLYNRNFLLKNRLYFKTGILHEDELWAFQCALKAERISIVNQITYNYLFHGSSIIFNKTKKNTEDLIYISQQIYSYYKKEKNLQRRSYIYQYYIMFTEQALRIIFQYIEDKEYFKQSYSRIKNNLENSLFKYLDTKISFKTKKILLMISLPAELGYRLFRYRYYRKISSFFKH